MKIDDYHFIAVFSILGGLMIFAAGGLVGRSEIRREAVTAGVAEWVADPVTGRPEFKWKGKSE